MNGSMTLIAVAALSARRWKEHGKGIANTVHILLKRNASFMQRGNLADNRKAQAAAIRVRPK
jgi:hypothetical protein